MPQASHYECVFYIPKTRDKELSDGKVHSIDAWEWLYEAFDGLTIAPGWHKGFWCDPETKRKASDLSAKYTVAVATKQLNALREILAEACERFQQKVTYLSIRGQVEFVGLKRK